MGGGKKTLANKLAKMSDEDRARYLERKAELEEEAKRRKEQLIATFMKKKIKKEDAFTRLNVAKINQNWHQILRKSKCKEMKENVEHMKKWVERVIVYKNRTISKLMEELEHAEEQYLNNFQCHANHVDNVVENQNQYIDKLDDAYIYDLEEILKLSEEERRTIINKADDSIKHLQTILYAQDSEAKKKLRAEHEDYMQRCYETESEFQSTLSHLERNLSKAATAIWRDIATAIAMYVKKTDVRRSHLAELKRLDAESAAEIEENQERILRQEDSINNLKKYQDNLLIDRDAEIKALEEQIEVLNKHFFKIRKTLHNELQVDNKKLRLLTDVSYNSLEYLNGLHFKVGQMLTLNKTCNKFKTERESISKYLSIRDIESFDDQDLILDVSKHIERDNAARDIKGKVKSPKKGSPSSQKASPFDKSRLRPKTSLPKKGLTDGTTLGDTPTPDIKRMSAVDSIIFQAKRSEDSEEPSESSKSVSRDESIPSEGIIDRCYNSLKKLENFWLTYNMVEVDYMEIREERKILENENKQLRGMIRAVLESMALSKTASGSKVSTRLPSRSRSAYSLPPRRMLFL